MTNLSFDLYALVTLLIMAVALPLVGIWDFHRLLRHLDEGRANARKNAYNWILVMEWGLVLAFVGWWLGAGRGWAPLGLVPEAAGWQWVALGLGLAATAFMIGQMIVVVRSTKELAKVRDQMGDLAGMAPQTPSERRQFVWVAITAGVCEEILYRGVLMAILTPLTGLWPAVALSSVIFGLGHAYQGFSGIAKTGLIGLVMALLTVYSGSLLVAIVLHAVVDLTSGHIMSTAIRAESPDLEPEAQPT